MAVDHMWLAEALAAIVADPSQTADFPQRLCAVCHAALPVAGVSLSLMTREKLDARGLLAASDEQGTRITELQFDLGEGPCVSAFSDRRPVLVPDLRTDQACARWPMFTREAAHVGIAAVFAFPLQAGAIGIGVLGCHRTRPGPLRETAEARVLADAVTMALLTIGMRAGRPGLFDMSWRTYTMVDQATGMVAAQLGVPVADALARLRAYAFRRARPLHEVACEVLAGGLHFTP